MDFVQSNSNIDESWFHDVGLSYNIALPESALTQDEQSLSLAWSLSFTDGAYDTDAVLSHSTINLSTAWEWEQFYFTPLLAYQFSMEDTVNHEDDFYVMISTGISF